MKKIFLSIIYLSAVLLSAQQKTRITGTYFPIYKDGKMGYMDSVGNIVLNPTLDQADKYELELWDKEFLVIKGNSKKNVADRSLNILLANSYDDVVIDYENKLFCVSNSSGSFFLTSNCGFLDFNGNEVIPIKYSNSFLNSKKFCDGLWCFRDENDKSGYLNVKNEIQIKPIYYIAYDFTNGYAIVKVEKDGLYGVIDKNGIWTIPPKYKAINSFSKSGFTVACMPNSKSYVIIDAKGKVIASMKQYVPSVGFSTSSFDDFNLIKVTDTITKLIGYMDIKGNMKIPAVYTEANYIEKDGYLIVNKGGHDDDSKYFKNKIGGEWKVIKYTGEVAFKAPSNVRRLISISENYVMFQDNNLKYGFLDMSGNIAIPAKYDEMPSNFQKGLARIYGARVYPKGSFLGINPFGYIDKKGVVVWEISH